MTAATLIAYLASLPPETPVVVPGDWARNFEEAKVVTLMVHRETESSFFRSKARKAPNDTQVVVIR